MKRNFNIMILQTFLLLLFIGCSNEIDPDTLPSFDGINGDENTIYFMTTPSSNNYGYYYDEDDAVDQILAIDTISGKKIYTYEFNKHRYALLGIAHDSSFDINPYILISPFYGDRPNKLLKLDVKSGESKQLDIDFIPRCLQIVADRLWSCNLYGHYDQNKNFFTYNAKTNSSSYINIPTSILKNGMISINNNEYFCIEYTYYSSNDNSKVYNLTTKKILSDNFLTRNYNSFSFHSNKYVVAEDSTTDSNGSVYSVDSFEPNLVCTPLFTYNKKNNYISEIYEDSNYLYTIGGEKDNYEYKKNISVTKRDKQQNYDIDKTQKISGTYIEKSYFKNGYLWILNSNYTIYRVDINDLSYRIIN